MGSGIDSLRLTVRLRGSGAIVLIGALLAFLLVSESVAGADRTDLDSLIGRMKAAYATVEDYQTTVTVRGLGRDGSVELQEFLYTFKKPDHIRMDFETPHRGAVLVYPDGKGKVLLRLPVLGGHLPLRFSPDNPRLMSGGQRVNETDLGLLIERISHSVTDERVGDCSTTDDGRYIDIRVLARNHFTPTITTLYRFRVDKATSLPVEVDESTADGRLLRRVTFGNIKVNIGVTDQFMQGA